MNSHTFAQINRLLRREIVPATGCTEPACIALCAAYAVSLLKGEAPLSVCACLSGNMLKNAMGVGIPGTGQTGVNISIALGLLRPYPHLKLELLDGVSAQEIDQAKALCQHGDISVEVKAGADVPKLYVEVWIVGQEGNTARAVIEHEHTQLALLQYNGQDVEPSSPSLSHSATEEDEDEPAEEDLELSFDLIYRYATEAPLEQLDFLYEAALVNKGVSEYSLQHSYGHSIGRIVQSPFGKSFLGDSPLSRMLSYTCGACDARMDGATMTVMTNSGSGNQGISAMLPVLAFAETQGASRECTTRALAISNLLVIHTKRLLGRLSALCGMVVSGLGVSAALVYILGGSKEQSAYAIHNVVGNLAGVICDGAKPSCSLKMSSATSSALMGAMLAMQCQHVKAHEGIVEEDVEASIRNFARLGRDGMSATDEHILNMMSHKGQG